MPMRCFILNTQPLNLIKTQIFFDICQFLYFRCAHVLKYTARPKIQRTKKSL